MKVKAFILPFIIVSLVVIHSIIPFRINIINLFKNPLAFFSSIKISIQTYNQLLSENKKLKQENEHLLKNQILSEDLKRENRELKRLFNFKKASSLKLTGAKVIGRDISGFLTSIIIDKGVKSGIKRGSAVINNIGLVGRVSEAGPDTSQVLLISDSNLSVSAVLERSRAQGIVCGGIGGYLVMKYIDEADVNIGDKVLTSNLSQVYPEGILIGEVIRVEKDLFNKELYVVIKPVVELEKLEVVLVVG